MIRFFVLGIYFILWYNLKSQVVVRDANKIFKGASQVYFNKNSTFPAVIEFKNNKIELSDIEIELKKRNINFVLTKTENDNIGQKHLCYNQIYNNVRVENATFKIHLEKNFVKSLTGTIYENIKVENTIKLSFEEAYKIAFKTQKVKKLNNKIKPDSEIVLYNSNNVFLYTYKIPIYSYEPFAYYTYYIDVENGNIIARINNIRTYDVNGTAVTKYSGTQTITTDFYNGYYRLRETGRGNGIATLNMQMTTDYNNAVDFTDDDNYWNNFNANQDEVATDAHWATEKYYDYFYQTFNRNSIDNNGFALYNYVHANLVEMGFSNNVNAFWDGTCMTYGDGNQSYGPLTTVDIVAHEITHGLTEFTAGLIYADESGALNEAFSDIFGCVVEHYAKPSQANWTIGEDIGSAFRSIKNPNLFNDPDTYHGQYWDPNGEVHQNSTVFSHWFYIVSQGESGVNDLGNSYSVTGIGIDKAAQIAYRMLVYYLPENCTYHDTRIYAILAATDLFGSCSPEVEAVTNAMYAIGLGDQYVPYVVADFTSSMAQNCSAPFTVQFYNQSINASSFYWNFGDGTFSTELNPVHTYNSEGNFNVTLIANGDNCGSDTTIKENYVSIVPSNPCIYIMPLNGTGQTITACTGILYDGGGPTSNYIDQSDAYITIVPQGASNIVLTFNDFDIEPGDAGYCNYDFLEIFDGSSTSSPSLGRFCNTTGSPGTIQTTNGAVTLWLHSDQALNKRGFEMVWQCNLANSAPVANFSISYINPCAGLVMFADNSTNYPTQWLWNFGDGDVSTQQNPSHVYLNSGTYTVTLIAINEFGSDTVTYENIVTINLAQDPIVSDTTVCSGDDVFIIANSIGKTYWYYNFVDNQPFYIGDTLFIFNVEQNQNYWVQNVEINPSGYVGETNVNSTGGYFSNSPKHYLVFDCYQQCELVSVLVNASNEGYRLIELQDNNGNVLQSKNVYIPQGVSRISLNFQLPVQNNLRLVGPPYPNLWRNSNCSCAYPYTIPDVLSIKYSSASTNPTGYYYYFYDWEIKLPDCYSARIPVNINVDTCQSIEIPLNYDICPIITDNYIYLNYKFDEGDLIKIIDITGKNLLKSIQHFENGIVINISKLSSGVYFIVFQSKEKNFVKKFIRFGTN